MADRRPFISLEEFLFEAPLYEQVRLPGTEDELKSIEKQPMDGYCPECGERSMFLRRGKLLNRGDWGTARGSNDMTLQCVRNEKHFIYFHVLFVKWGLQKIGQYPSFATIAQGSVKEYRRLLSKEDGSELTKAIGLAAHDAGIGAFIYIRRIFERIIRKCFDEHKDAEGWTEDQYLVRMDDKILLMKDHLPDFLIQNRKLYKILSNGVHNLTETDCLAFFSVARESIMHILEEEKRKKDEKARRAALQMAIAEHSATKPSV
jgi:hypothetical protein